MFKAIGQHFYDSGKALIELLWNGIKYGIGAYLKVHEYIHNKLREGLKFVGSFLFDKGKELIGGFWNGIKWFWNDVIKSFGNWIYTEIKNIVNTIADFSKMLWDKGKELAAGFWGAIVHYWNNPSELGYQIGTFAAWVINKY